jgi:hypothetical protein
MVTVQVDPANVLPHPAQWSKYDPGDGLAVNITVAPLGKFALHCEPGQSIPVGVLVTEPD